LEDRIRQTPPVSQRTRWERLEDERLKIREEWEEERWERWDFMMQGWERGGPDGDLSLMITTMWNQRRDVIHVWANDGRKGH
jgi:hypothetical protein